MSYKTLMVHLDLNLESGNKSRLHVAQALAARFRADVIGIAAAQPMQTLYGESLTYGDVMLADRTEIREEIAAAEAQFRKALAGCGTRLDWRAAVTYEPLAAAIAAEARAADLIITGPDIGFSLLDNTRRVRIGDLALWAGRPVLIVPPGIAQFSLHQVFVGWKESRESRRALADALPLLQEAEHVSVLEAAPDARLDIARRHLADVIHWLEGHGVHAKPLVTAITGTETGHLRAELLERRCNLLVAGAYGHSRLGEFTFGGMTRDVLLNPDFCTLISH